MAHDPRINDLTPAQLRSLAEAVVDATDAADMGLVVTVASDDGVRGVYASPSAARLLGRDRKELLEHPLLSLVAPEELERMRELAASRERGERPPQVIETVVLGGDGRRIPLEVALGDVAYEGSPATVCFLRDISERRSAEAALMQSDRLATVGTLAAGVAHEINNPLAYVMLNLGFLSRQLEQLVPGDADRARVRELLDSAQDGLERVATIVRDLRSVSRWDGDAKRIVDPAEVMRSALNIAANEIGRRARLEVDVVEARPVLVNEGRLGQVYLNLLLNAAQAIPEGAPDENEIRVCIAPTGSDAVSIEVRDTGCGIDREDLARIFEPFFTTKPPGLGTGLGLSICQGIVASAGGFIEVESEAGKGTTFRVQFPAAAARGAEKDGPSSSLPASAERPIDLRVLVVDDDRPLADALREAMEPTWQVDVAADGREALSRLSREPFDVILCDLVMPVMDGRQLHEALRVRSPGMERRMVFMTGADTLPWVAEFLAKVENPRATKPFDVNVLRNTVRAIASNPLPAAAGVS